MKLGKLEYTEFKALSGCLNAGKWIQYQTTGCRRGTWTPPDQDGGIMGGKIERELCKGYKPEGIWHENETGCFFHALLEKSLAEEGGRCRGGKQSKHRMTLASAGKEKHPLIFGNLK